MDHWNAVDILEKNWQESAKLFCCVKRFCQIFQNYTMDACILWKMFLYTLNTRTITEKKERPIISMVNLKKKKSDTSYGPYSVIIIYLFYKQVFF